MSDKAQIQEVISLYSYSASVRDYETIATLFTPGATWETFGDPNFKFKCGPPNLLESLREVLEMSTVLTQMNSPAIINLDGDTATASCLINETGQMETAKLKFSMFGRYNDKLKKVNGDWLFASREFTIMQIHTGEISP